MQLNIVLKRVLLTLPVLVIVACGSKNNSNDNELSTIGAAGNGMESTSSNLSYDESSRMKLQELQKDNTVYFGYDRYEVTPEYSHLLDTHAAFLRDNPSYKVTIEGYTDERGTPEYNIALGERRANAVKMYLQGRGVSEEQISIVSYGKEKPAVLGHDEAAYEKNRRAVLVY